jgi:glutamate-1-semialdehyde 2,1-aminomutase
MEQLDAATAKAAGREKIGHQGTFNANPLCAAAAVAALGLVETSDACARAEASAEALRQGLRKLLVEEGVPWGVYGESSVFIVFPNPKGLPIDPASFDPAALGFEGIKGARDPHLINRLRLALLTEGVDIMGGPGGMVSATHGPQEVAQTLQAFRSALRRLKAEGDIRWP